MRSTLVCGRFAAVLACAALAATPALARSVAQFYKGRTISMLVPTSPGGINDISARLVARYLPRYIPGHPAVAVHNEPGAGGLILANRMYNEIPKDGLTIGIVERATPLLAIQKDPNARFDPMRFTWLGSVSSFANDAYLLLVNSSSPVRTVADLKKPGVSIKIGGDQPGSTNLTFALIAKKALGLNVDVIRGYPGAAPMFVAMQSGELDGQIIGYGSVRAGQHALWYGGKLRPLIQFARRTRLPALKNVPTGRELAPNAAAKALIQFAELPFFMALPFFAPPGLPPDRAKALESAFMKVTRDPRFLKRAKALHLDISPVDGAGVRAVLAKAAATPPGVIAQYSAIVGQGPKRK
ncbi:MAG TPA: tripartite tricarboxylate transporter substrate-binding protein [Beijerinckiaceae bacterium]|nr:tripartite tricarboxylate transporter substrate-binding protein [Beijerinckiaceae bacterium]